MSETESKRNRRTILENDVALLQQLQAASQDGPVSFKELKPEQKLALLPSGNSRLIRFKLVTLAYDPETYAPTTVTINDEVVTKFADDIEAANDPKIVNRRVSTGEPAMRRPRSVLADEKYLIGIRTTDNSNPRRPDTLGYFNWSFYDDGQTVAAYLNKPQTNESRLMQTSKGKWYDGPSTTYLYEDVKAGHIGIYDSTIEPTKYLTMDEIEQLMADHRAAKNPTNEETTETEQMAA
jgi:hypothetical protein